MPEQSAWRLGRVHALHTLGPPGTNLEAAAHEWFRRQDRVGTVELHETLESALSLVGRDGTQGLLACVVYPALHTLVFENLAWLEMVDSFLMPTHPMVLAARTPTAPTSVATHPAPRSLVPPSARVKVSSSNSQAAVECRDGLVEGCVTTLPAANAQGLYVLQDFGCVPMGFTVHLPSTRGDRAAR